MNIFVQPVGSAQEPMRITAEKDRDITDYFWKGANRVVYLKDFGGDENDHVVVVDRRSGEPRDVTPFPGVKAQVDRRAGRVSGPDADRPQQAREGSVRRRTSSILRRGTLTLVAENPGNITSWGADHAGRIRYAIATDGVEQDLPVPRDAGGAVQAGAEDDLPRPVRAAVLHGEQPQALRRLEHRPRQGRDRARRSGDRQGGAALSTRATTSTWADSHGRSARKRASFMQLTRPGRTSATISIRTRRSFRCARAPACPATK